MNIDKELYQYIGIQLKKARVKKEMSLDTLSMLINGEKTKSSLKRYEDGNSRIEMETLELICKKLDLDYLEVISNAKKQLSVVQELSKNNNEHIYLSAGLDFIRIPLYGPLCCGNGGFVEDNIIEYVPVPSKGLTKSPEEYFAQIASGESMKDAGINNGDLLVFERVGVINIGVIGCFCIDENEATCKKYKEMNGIIMLQPMNSEFEPIIIDPMNTSFKILGILKKIIKDVE